MEMTTPTPTTKCEDCNAEIYPEETVFIDDAYLCDNCAFRKRLELRNQKRRIPKTVKPKYVIVGDKAFFKCIDSDCGLMIEDKDYVPKSEMRLKNLYAEEEIYKHVREVHKLVWFGKGGKSGWWPLYKFHPRPEVER